MARKRNANARRGRWKPASWAASITSGWSPSCSDRCTSAAPGGTWRDKAGNRELFFDQYALLMLLDYFNPIVESLRGLQQITQLEKVQKLCGIQKTSLRSLSEAASVFDPHLLEPIIADLSRQALAGSQALPRPHRQKAHEAALAGLAGLAGLTAVDGSLPGALPGACRELAGSLPGALPGALPRMAWAVWQDATHRPLRCTWPSRSSPRRRCG